MKQVHPVLARAGAVFVGVAVTLVVALLLPVHENLLDILWVCAFCLAGAATLICVAAKSSVDLAGFVPIVSVLTLLRIALGGVTARKIIAHDSTGILIGSFGKFLAASWPLGAVLAGLVLATVLVIVIFGACQRITLAANNYFQQVLPLKRIGVETDLRMGLIDETNAASLYRRINSEFRFFSGMNSTSLLMRSEAAICIFILIACVIMPATTRSFETTSGADYLARVAPGVIALSVFALIPAIIVSVACGILMSKNTLALRTKENAEPAHTTKKIMIIAQDTGLEEEIELLNPDFVEHKDRDERIVEFEPLSRSHSADTHTRPEKPTLSKTPEGLREHTAPLVEPVTLRCKSTTDYYEQLSGLIDTIHSRPRVVLLASEIINTLPITVAVNIAIRLAQKKQKILLVDTDTRQNAVAQVFEMDPRLIRKKIQPSCFENVSVCGIPEEKLDNLMQKSNLLKQFDTTLIYVPNANRLKLRSHPNTPGPDVLYFTDKNDAALTTLAGEPFDACASIRLVPGIRSILQP